MIKATIFICIFGCISQFFQNVQIAFHCNQNGVDFTNICILHEVNFKSAKKVEKQISIQNVVFGISIQIQSSKYDERKVNLS